MNTLITLVVVCTALWALNDIRRRQSALESDTIEALKNLQVTLEYLDIHRKVTVPHVQAHYNVVGKIWMRILLVAILGFGALALFTNTTTVKLTDEEQSIKVITRDKFGLPQQRYDLLWHGENERNGKWMWRTRDDERFGLWKPADIHLLNGDRLNPR